MRKLLLLTLMSMIVLTACNKDDSKTVEEVNDEGNKSEAIEVDKGLLNVEITLPASLFQGREIDEVIEEAKAEGAKEVTQNSDGSLTYKMSKNEHKKVLSEMGDSIEQTMEEMKISEDFVSIQDVKANKSYSEFTMVVDRAKFENSFDGIATLALGATGMYYQAFNGVNAEEAKVTIHFEDADTGETFNTTVFPDDMNNQ